MYAYMHQNQGYPDKADSLVIINSYTFFYTKISPSHSWWHFKINACVTFPTLHTIYNMAVYSVMNLPN